MAGRRGSEGEADPLTVAPPTSAQLVEQAARVHAALGARGLTLATAESCTGGLVGHVLTEVPGSSTGYIGGVVSYANAAKEELVGVSEHTLERFGAVSAETATAMAQGIRARLHADVAVAVTGIAGPDGGSPEKPVGLTYVAVAGPVPGTVSARRFVWDADRTGNKHSSALAVLSAVLDALESARDGPDPS